jgi:hypothetical protein
MIQTTFKFKSILATAAFMACGVASAASGYVWNAGTGTGSLTFSTDALGALSTSGSVIRTDTPIAAGLPGAGSANSAVYNKTNGSVSLTFNDATGTGDTLASLTAANSLVNIRRTLLDDDGNVTGQRNVFMANFKVDITNSTIFADLYSNTGTGSTLASYGNKAIFTADVAGVSGGTAGVIIVDGVANGVATGHASGSLNGALRMNSATADIVLTALGLDTTGSVANLVKTANWGSTTASGTFTAPAAAVPEPSSYVLMGVGLAAMGLLRSRRNKA